MNYVLAGSSYLAVHSIIRGSGESQCPVADLLRDWLPFMLSMAITAGIAPLLFLQILYQEHFYTANLLLFYRWMAILPVLIIGFYLAYLLKSGMTQRWPIYLRGLVGVGVFACFAFVGFSWVENHLLSVDKEAWTAQYASGSVVFRSPELIPRFALWFTAAFPTMALFVGWQLWFRHFRLIAAGEIQAEDAAPVAGSKICSILALAGWVISTVLALVYLQLLPESAYNVITGYVGLPYLVLSAVGVVTQLIGWGVQLARGSMNRFWLLVTSAGLVINFIGMAVMNESTRLAALDITKLFDDHAAAWRITGFGLFLFFAVVNFSLIGFCIYLVRNYLQPVPTASDSGADAESDNAE